ncbi:MAG: PIN domain-containing protein [Thermomicrobiales bacterium]
MLEHPSKPWGTSAVALAEVLTGPAIAGDEALVRRVHRGSLRLPSFVVHELGESAAIETDFVRRETGLKLSDAAIVASAR